MRNLISVAILAPAILLVGCSDSSNFYPPQGNNNTAKGKVYDGYLANARVCVDENLSRACDASEPSEPTVQTNGSGDFTFTGLTDRQAAQPLVVEVIPGTTTDLDYPNDPARPSHDLKFIAPAGSTAVSAFSTIIQYKIEAALAAGSTDSLADLKAAAIQQLEGALGVSGLGITSYDPIAAKTNTALKNTDRIRAAKLHIVNQILSEQIATLLQSVTSSAGAFAAVIDRLDPEDVMIAVNNSLTSTEIADYLDPTAISSVVGVTPPAAPTPAEIVPFTNLQAVILAAFNSRLPAAPATGGTGTGGGGG